MAGLDGALMRNDPPADAMRLVSAYTLPLHRKKRFQGVAYVADLRRRSL
jgi:hypothetical protein